MNIKDFSALLKAKAAELNDFRHRKLPVLVGRTAKDHNDFIKTKLPG